MVNGKICIHLGMRLYIPLMHIYEFYYVLLCIMLFMFSYSLREDGPIMFLLGFTGYVVNQQMFCIGIFLASLV